MENQQKKPDIGISYTEMGKDEYALTFAIENRHVSMAAWNYTHRPAYHADFAIFDMKLNDIFNLALAIMQKATQIKDEIKQ